MNKVNNVHFILAYLNQILKSILSYSSKDNSLGNGLDFLDRELIFNITLNIE